MHTCTEKDFDKFYEPSEQYANRFEYLRQSGSMQCIDWETSGVEFYGSVSSDNFGTLDVNAVPCSMGLELREADGGVYEEPPADCNWDK